MSSSRTDTNVSFVKIEIGTSEPSEVRIDIEGSPYVLGRHADSAMRFDERRVLLKHATIEIVNGKVSLVDQSRAGTWVNGVPLVKNQPFPLMVGDRINLGSEDTVLMVGGEGGGTLEYFLTRNPNPKPELELDIAGRAVLRNGFNIDQPLTQTEFDVLWEMYQHKGQVITFERLWAIVSPMERWPILHSDADSDEEGNKMKLGNHKINQFIYQLRRKIERPGSKPVIVLNSPGVGYKMLPFAFLDKPPFAGD